jgi:S1-C subfamily serine protease
VSIVNQIRSSDASGTVHIGQTAFLGVQTTDASPQGPYGYGGGYADPYGNGYGDGSGQSGSGSGATVAGVVAGSPAEDAGLTAGDVITAVDGDAVTSADGLGALIAAHHPGDTVKIAWTDSFGAAHTVDVQLTEGPAK